MIGEPFCLMKSSSPLSQTSQTEEDICPLCKRPLIHKSNHHLTPKCRGGREKTLICSDCHRTAHALFSNKQLEREFNTVEALMSDERMRKAVAFLAKQDPHRRYKSVLARDQRKRGRNA
jgi:hypothetical protein